MEVLPAVVISLGIAVFALALVTTFLVTLQDTQTEGAYDYNSTQAGLEGLSEFNNWWVILAIAAVFLIIFGILAVIRSRTASI